MTLDDLGDDKPLLPIEEQIANINGGAAGAVVALAIALADLIRWCDAFGLRGGYGLPNRRALIATITVLTDISTAPNAGVSTIPQGAATPAASGIANAL